MGIREVFNDWLTQPQDSPTPSEDWIDRGMVALFDCRQGRELILDVPATTDAVPRAASTEGIAPDFSNIAQVYPHRPQYGVTGPLSILVYCDVDALTNSGDLIGKGSGTFTTATPYGLKIGVSATDSRISLLRGGNPGVGSNNWYMTASAANTFSAPINAIPILVVDPTGLLQGTRINWANGTKSSATQVAGIARAEPVTDGGGSIYIGKRDTVYLDGRIYFIAVFNRALSDDEAQSLSSNPWQVYEPQRVIVPVIAAGTQTLTPALYTNTNTFYNATVSTSTTLTPALYTNTNTFYGPTVSSTYALLPSLYTNNNVFYGPTVSATYALSPSLYTNTNTFYGPTVTVGTVTLSPSLYTNTNTFYSAVVSQGGVVLQPDLYTNTNTFYSPTVTTGAVTLLPSLYTNANTFYSPTITVGAVTLLPSLYSNTNTFYSATVTLGGATQTLTPALYSNTNVFYSPTVTVGTVTLLPSLYTNTNEFYSPTVSQAGTVIIYPELFVNTNTFFGHYIFNEYPDPTDVRFGVKYGPSGIYTGALLVSPGETSVAIRSFTRKF